MEAFAERVAATLWSSPPAVFYVGLAGSAFLETLFPPYPGDTVTVVGGALAGGGRLLPLLVWLSSVAGCFVGTMLLFFAGRSGGRRFLHGRLTASGRAEDAIRVEHWMLRWGKITILGSRFLPAVRSLIAVGAGTTGMRTSTVAVLSLVGIAVWQALLVWGGVFLGANWHHLSRMLARYSQAVLTIALCVMVVILARIAWRRR